MTILSSGKLLIIPSSLWDSANTYDPATRVASATGGMTARHAGGAATLLPNDQVLVAGGFVAVEPVTTSVADCTTQKPRPSAQPTA